MEGSFQSPRLVTIPWYCRTTSFVSANPAPNSCPTPSLHLSFVPSADQSDTLKHHGQSGGGQDGEVRHPMTLQYYFLISPAAEKAKARGRHARLEKSHPQARGNVGIQATRVPLSRVLNRGKVHACQC